MKSIKTSMAALLLIVAILLCVSCKKESTTPATPIIQDLITGKWKLQSIVTNDFYTGSSHITNYTGTAADYADFRNDGKLYSFIQNGYDTVPYKKISDTKMWIADSTSIYDIQALTSTQLKLYNKEIYNAAEYYESTLIFYK